ncbi:Gamma-glutamyltranspeptidase precursor [gamma proteobacterium HdN1]|nr:Gamma-glutamyltranspeptidase precursor [gamma proteobacterium HdN1]
MPTHPPRSNGARLASFLRFAQLRSARTEKWLGGVLLLFVLGACTQPEIAENSASITPSGYAISSAHPSATQAGQAVLEQGGNAFDAAIAVAAALAVVEPYSAGMGGGGFWLLHNAQQNRDVMVDAREKAPLSASRDMYMDLATGKLREGASINGPFAAGIPGQAAAFAHIAQNYGRLPLERSLAPAIALAQNGFPANHIYLNLLEMRRDVLARYPESKRIFLNDGHGVQLGTLIRQPELAETLKHLAHEGHDGFYRGPVAEQLVKGVNQNGGDWQLADLYGYQVVERDPIRVSIQLRANQGAEPVKAHLITAPPPSSGGVALAEMFNMLNEFPWAGLNRADQTHLLIEVMRRAYRDRAEYLGDPDFVHIPLATLLSQAHASKLASSIQMQEATSSLALGRRLELSSGTHTTHFSIIDAQGNSVAATLSINLPFGSAYTAEGTGVLLNNEMDDFSAHIGVPNAYGLVGSEANAVAPGKRPLSSMTPSFLEFERDGQHYFAALGTPGGSRIISMVFLGLLQALQGAPVQDWVNVPRFHHQYLPDEIQFEPDAFDAATLASLKARGHSLRSTKRAYGNMQAVLWQRDTDRLTAAADRRGIGEAVVVEKR